MRHFIIALPLILAACTSTSTTRLNQNELLITTSADSDCMTAGAMAVASKMAAVETIRHGFERYTILGSSRNSDPNMIYIPSDDESIFAGDFLDFGSYDASLRVRMFNPGDPGYRQGLDAREQLGPEWPKLVENGINGCLS